MGRPKRIFTGIAGLDAQLGGGVPQGTSILLLADSSNALYQFLDEVAGFGMDRGESVLWFELDRPWDLVRAGFGSTAQDSPGHLEVLHAYEPRMGDASANGSGVSLQLASPEDVPNLASKLVSEAEPSNYRLVLASLSTLLQSVPAAEVQALVRQLVALNQSMGGLMVLTLIKEAHPPEQVARLKHACTAVFEIGSERKGFGLYSYLKVEKLLGIPDAARLLLFNETEEGLRLESTRRVF